MASVRQRGKTTVEARAKCIRFVVLRLLAARAAPHARDDRRSTPERDAAPFEQHEPRDTASVRAHIDDRVPAANLSVNRSSVSSAHSSGGQAACQSKNCSSVGRSRSYPLPPDRDPDRAVPAAGRIRPRRRGARRVLGGDAWKGPGRLRSYRQRPRSLSRKLGLPFAGCGQALTPQGDRIVGNVSAPAARLSLIENQVLMRCSRANLKHCRSAARHVYSRAVTCEYSMRCAGAGWRMSRRTADQYEQPSDEKGWSSMVTTRFGLTVLVLSIAGGAGVQVAQAQAQLPRFLPDVVAQFNALSMRPDPMGFHIGDGPDPSQCRHHQAMLRIEAVDGTPYLYMTRSGPPRDLCLKKKFRLRPKATRSPNLYIVQMGSREKHGERLRSNRMEHGARTTNTHPIRATRGALDPLQQLPTDSTGNFWPPSDHPAGMQQVGNIVAIGGDVSAAHVWFPDPFPALGVQPREWVDKPIIVQLRGRDRPGESRGPEHVRATRDRCQSRGRGADAVRRKIEAATCRAPPATICWRFPATTTARSTSTNRTASDLYNPVTVESPVSVAREGSRSRATCARRGPLIRQSSLPWTVGTRIRRCSSCARRN